MGVLTVLELVVTACMFLNFTLIFASENCETPNHKHGSCIVITECPAMYSLLRKGPKNTTSASVADYLRQSQCGFQGHMPKVCCHEVPAEVYQEKVVEDDWEPYLLPFDNACGDYSEDRLHTDRASIDEYRWNVLLVYETEDNRKEILCAGTLISERYVLTAAHCLKEGYLPPKTKLVSVRLGDYDLKTDPDCESFQGWKDCADPFEEIAINETIVHEDYMVNNSNQYNDIALIRLQNRTIFTSFIGPVCLSKNVLSNNTFRYVQGAGWGIYKSRKPTEYKKRIHAEIRNASFCNEGFHVKLNQNQICVAKIYDKWYADDSGGGLFAVSHKNALYYVVGVMSFGSSSLEGYPRVYIKVEDYLDWIISKLKI